MINLLRTRIVAIIFLIFASGFLFFESGFAGGKKNRTSPIRDEIANTQVFNPVGQTRLNPLSPPSTSRNPQNTPRYSQPISHYSPPSVVIQPSKRSRIVTGSDNSPTLRADLPRNFTSGSFSQELEFASPFTLTSPTGSYRSCPQSGSPPLGQASAILYDTQQVVIRIHHQLTPKEFSQEFRSQGERISKIVSNTFNDRNIVDKPSKTQKLIQPIEEEIVARFADIGKSSIPNKEKVKICKELATGSGVEASGLWDAYDKKTPSETFLNQIINRLIEDCFLKVNPLKPKIITFQIHR